MKKNSIIIIGVAIAIGLGITAVGISYYESISILVDTPTLSGRISSESISSGPLMLTKSQYKIHENIFYIVDGLKEDEKGNIRFFVPDGRLYRTTAYDGAIKESFNLYFRPDTSYLTEFCVQKVKEILVDCDSDAIIYLVEPSGPACHTGEKVCFHNFLKK